MRGHQQLIHHVIFVATACRSTRLVATGLRSTAHAPHGHPCSGLARVCTAMRLRPARRQTSRVREPRRIRLAPTVVRVLHVPRRLKQPDQRQGSDLPPQVPALHPSPSRRSHGVPRRARMRILLVQGELTGPEHLHRMVRAFPHQMRRVHLHLMAQERLFLMRLAPPYPTVQGAPLLTGRAHQPLMDHERQHRMRRALRIRRGGHRAPAGQPLLIYRVVAVRALRMSTALMAFACRMDREVAVVFVCLPWVVR